jgi:hypothetical protein
MSLGRLIELILKDPGLITPTVVARFQSAITVTFDTNALDRCSDTAVTDPNVTEMCGAAYRQCSYATLCAYHVCIVSQHGWGGDTTRSLRRRQESLSE